MEEWGGRRRKGKGGKGREIKGREGRGREGGSVAAVQFLVGIGWHDVTPAQPGLPLRHRRGGRE